MVDRNLKKEKEDILKFLYEKIDVINNPYTLKCILEKVQRLNELLDIYDRPLENLFSDINVQITKNEKKKIKKLLSDIFDKYDARNKSGELIYSESNRKDIQQLIKEINEECDKSFLDRFLTILGIGS
mgnify:CR=1 FL=1